MLSAARFAVADVTFNVNTTDDRIDDDVTDGVCHTSVGTCSLRAAIMQVNRLSVALTTIHVPSGTYVLVRPPAGADDDSNGDLNIANSVQSDRRVVVSGAGSAITIIDAHGIDRVIKIEQSGNVTLEGMTFRNGLARPQGSETLGGAIQNGATLTVSGCIIENSVATRGGGIFSSGPLTLKNTTVQSNTAEYGGGISTSGPFMNLRNCRVRDNHSGFGGGILASDQGFFPAILSLSDCIVEDNDAASGGGVFFSSSSGELTVLRTTIRHNHAAITAGVGGGLYSGGVATTRIHDSLLEANSADFGGGIYDEFSHTLAVVNSTLSSNTANTNGGGIYSAGLTLFANVSVVNNDADQDRDEIGGIGGGIYVSSGAFRLQNSLVAANTIVNAPIFDDCNGVVMTSGKNLLGETDGCTFGGSGPGAVGSVSLGTIGPLQDNGGPTLTHALTAGSEAIDATPEGFPCIDENGAVLATDQRGAARVAALRCDVGAFEYGASFDRIFSGGFE